MKFLIAILLTLCFTHSQADTENTLTRVSELIWKNRVILIWTDSPAFYQNTLKQFSAGMKDRDIVWFIFNGSKITSNFRGLIADTFVTNTTRDYLPGEHTLLLIGKDGGIKVRHHQLRPNDLFEIIDQMPMRQYEIKARQQNGPG